MAKDLKATYYDKAKVEATIRSIQHTVKSFAFGLKNLADDAQISKELVKEMQHAINAQWDRMFLGLPTIIEYNHARTRPEEEYGQE
ncbi:MAG: hypothetical protein IKA93_01855 [Elusimicrobiaceae bacterium]|nr:hypothetical protein [Elusimicrobiaceae bacterium]